MRLPKQPQGKTLGIDGLCRSSVPQVQQGHSGPQPHAGCYSIALITFFKKETADMFLFSSFEQRGKLFMFFYFFAEVR